MLCESFLMSIADSKVRSPSGEPLHSLFTANISLWSISTFEPLSMRNMSASLVAPPRAPIFMFLTTTLLEPPLMTMPKLAEEPLAPAMVIPAV